MTEIKKVSTNYTVNGSNDKLKMNGEFSYDNKIHNLNLSVSSEDEYIGNIYYNLAEDDNTNVSMNVNVSYMMDSMLLLNEILNDITNKMIE